ncbi:hypothetical protein CMI40_00740 [Candidatus Pacearchaeota archaeon]|jgi:replication factor C large subunit|nr:hypothetical protein [Candidatus Pacearchaeota archaeon]|tara:strand:+ start:15345 stop:16535 length:1191 start_codon:yes stop_codon:yes gene_type:complete
MQWTEKHRPKYSKEIQGQNEAIAKIKNFVENFYLGKLTKTKKKALVLHGPPGIGKTTLAHAIARETNSEIFELNASDLRNKLKLKEILKPAIEQQSLIKKGKIILVDEVDGISAADRGGLTELLSLITLTNFPIIITANDIWNAKLSGLRKKAELVNLKEVDYNTIKDVMINILRKENHFINNNILTKIAIKSRGDLRAAINDLQTISSIKDPTENLIDERKKEIDIFNALRLVFKGKPTDETLRIYDSVKMPIDNIILWVEENVPLEYQKKELKRAYDLISKVDVFKKRIYRQQYWRFLVYKNILLSYGISSSKEDIKTGFTNYNKPTRILKIWLNNQKTFKKKSIAKKYARKVHVGEKRIMNEFPVIRNILKNPEVRRELRLSDEEIAYLDKPI